MVIYPKLNLQLLTLYLDYRITQKPATLQISN